MAGRRKLVVGISCGDINGIGLETALKAFEDHRMFDTCTPVMYCSTQVVNFYRKLLNLNDIPIQKIKKGEKPQHGKMNIIEPWEEDVKAEPGKIDPATGSLAMKSLQLAVEELASNRTDVLVTAPINKKLMQSSEFSFPGHTEYLASYANEENPLMILTSEDLRVALVTGHIALGAVSKNLTQELILKKLYTFNKSLKLDFGIPKPRIAVLALNPHAGDAGMMGDEEEKVISPALKQATEEGILAFGPFPSDGFFGSPTLKQYDGILAMYHDQGLTPFKALSFDSGVNFTAGLPIVRTSPDHGTAYDIAGQNVASASSFRQAVLLALDIYYQRIEERELIAGAMENQTP